MTLTVSAFYKFVAIADPASLRARVMEECSHREILGTILIAEEGINGTISGDCGSLSAFFEWLRTDIRFADLEVKNSAAEAHPFGRLKVRVRREIVSFGTPEANPTRAVGIYVAPENWNALIEDPNIVVVDTRNAYEVKIGSFKGAIDPKTRSFRQFPAFVRQNLDPKNHRRIAMFCTGGIRCEKASSYLLSQGFREVYQLRGGILNYLETVPEEQSLWQGECFVFDERVAIGHGVEPGSHGLCLSCGAPTALGNGQTAESSADLRCEDCSAAQPSSMQ